MKKLTSLALVLAMVFACVSMVSFGNILTVNAEENYVGIRYSRPENPSSTSRYAFQLQTSPITDSDVVGANKNFSRTYVVYNLGDAPRMVKIWVRNGNTTIDNSGSNIAQVEKTVAPGAFELFALAFNTRDKYTLSNLVFCIGVGDEESYHQVDGNLLIYCVNGNEPVDKFLTGMVEECNSPDFFTYVNESDEAAVAAIASVGNAVAFTEMDKDDIYNRWNGQGILTGEAIEENKLTKVFHIKNTGEAAIFVQARLQSAANMKGIDSDWVTIEPGQEADLSITCNVDGDNINYTDGSAYTQPIDSFYARFFMKLDADHQAPAPSYMIWTDRASDAPLLKTINDSKSAFETVITEEPGGEQPGGEQPGGEQPGGEQPGGEQPGGEQPGGEQPGGEEPGGEQPCAVRFTVITDANQLILRSAKEFLSSANVKNGQITVAFPITNESEEADLGIRFALQTSAMKGDKKVWAGPNEANTEDIEVVTIAPGETEIVEYTMDVEDGKVEVFGEKYDLSTFFLRFDILQDGNTAVEAGALKFVIGANADTFYDTVATLKNALSADALTTTDALGHDYHVGEITAPTCTEQGYTTYVCSHDTSHTYIADYTEALGHDYEDTVIAPTYYAEGYTLHVCKRDPSHRYTDAVVPPVDDPTAPVFYSEPVSGCAERFARVPIYLKNNPGVISAQVRVSYDADVFTLVEVQDMKLLGGTNFPENLSCNPYTLSWENDLTQTDLTANGTVAILVFKIAADAPDGEHTITLESVAKNTRNADFEVVHILTENATVNVRHVTFGNIFDDGETGADSVNSVDRILLSRYLAGWDMSAYNLDLDAADINGDGRVTAKDRVILARYLAGWGGEYDTYFS
ncbi:MAG: hypothetical protein J6X30_01205 [Clostridia bacterium]|nr:hypothetical protein [Clostridia bacterium]